MFKPITLLILILLGINLWVYTTTKPAAFYQDVTTNSAIAPEGMQYMDYCDGGISEQLVAINDTVCIADYPGSFSRGMIPLLSLLALILSIVLFWLQRIDQIRTYFQIS